LGRKDSNRFWSTIDSTSGFDEVSGIYWESHVLFKWRFGLRKWWLEYRNEDIEVTSQSFRLFQSKSIYLFGVVSYSIKGKALYSCWGKYILTLPIIILMLHKSLVLLHWVPTYHHLKVNIYSLRRAPVPLIHHFICVKFPKILRYLFITDHIIKFFHLNFLFMPFKSPRSTYHNSFHFSSPTATSTTSFIIACCILTYSFKLKAPELCYILWKILFMFFSFNMCFFSSFYLYGHIDLVEKNKQKIGSDPVFLMSFVVRKYIH